MTGLLACVCAVHFALAHIGSDIPDLEYNLKENIKTEPNPSAVNTDIHIYIRPKRRDRGLSNQDITSYIRHKKKSRSFPPKIVMLLHTEGGRVCHSDVISGEVSTKYSSGRSRLQHAVFPDAARSSDLLAENQQQ